VKILSASGALVGPTMRAPAGRLSRFDARPQCISCAKILPSFACTAVVIGCHAAICAALKMPGIRA
jgi:hypothetical protein